MELQVLCLGILAVAGIEGFAINATQASHCRDGWTYYENGCYLFVSSEQDTWTEANSHCRILHSYLADILDEDENTFIKSQLLHQHVSGCFYISATDVQVEGQWVWPDTGDRVQYMDWGPAEPNSVVGEVENCACLWSYAHFQWADTSCHSPKSFICKIRLDPGTGSEIIG